MARNNPPQVEDASIIAAKKAVCRQDIELTSKGRTRYRAFSFVPEKSEIHLDAPIPIKKDRVIIALLVAPRRCGKTTLMSSMHREFQRIMGDDFCMEPFQKNDLRYEKLKENKDFLTAFTNAPGLNEGVAPSDSLEEFEFIIYHKKHPRLSFMLRFIDVPGEWVQARQEAMKILISEADILYITINSPALMEESGVYNEEFNASSTVVRLADVLKDESIRKRSRLLMFVPVKCEKYYWDMIQDKNTEGLKALNLKIQERYNELIHSVKEREALKNHTTAAITPIMTVGGAKFCQFMPIGANGHKDTYVRILGYITDSNGYRPTFCEQPLLYTLNFIKDRVAAQVKHGGLVNFFRDTKELGMPTAFRYAFHDPLCEAIMQKTKYADFGLFKSVEDFQKTESNDVGSHEKDYPQGMYADVDILGYSVIFRESPEPAGNN